MIKMTRWQCIKFLAENWVEANKAQIMDYVIEGWELPAFVKYTNEKLQAEYLEQFGDQVEFI